MSLKKLLTANHSIQYRFFLVALVPLLTITGLLTYYNIKARQVDALAELHDSGNNAASYVAAAADFPLYSGNQQMLTSLAASITQQNHVSGAMFLDKDYRPIASSGLFPTANIDLAKLKMPQSLVDEYLYFKRPVVLDDVSINDYEDAEKQATPGNGKAPIGWVVLAMDLSGIEAKNNDILATSISLAMVVMFIAFALTAFLGSTILRPIKHLTYTVRNLEAGNLNSRAKIDTDDELAILAKGINQLAQTVADNEKNLKHQISNATQELETSLDSLRTKNRELEFARHQAEMANQAKSDFLARMSHELRTPITAIQGFILLLTEAVESDSDRHYCKIINQASSQLLTLIDDILVFSKLQSNTVSLEKTPLNLAECVENVAALFSTTAQDKSLDLVVDIDPSLKLCRIGDSARISQVVNNLVSNAIKFTERGSVTILLKPVDRHTNKSVEISVRDTGIGIAMAHREQIFRAFAQADTSISRNYGGTGLGLSIVKSLVDLMEGEIVLESERNVGTVFSITLPLPCQKKEDRWPPLRYRVAIYADSKDNAQPLAHALDRFNCRADAFDNISNLPVEGYDAIFLCIKTDGILDQSFPEKVLQLRQSTPIKLIVLTPVFALSDLFTKDEISNMQPVTFLATPPTLNGLYQALNKIEDQSIAPAVMDSRPPLHNLNILIAEDNDFTGLLLETLIGKAGGQCTLATNGLEAVKVSQREHFDIILIDVHMPEMNGIDATKAIRLSNGPNANTPIIALTADILQQDEDNLLKAGANDLLFKPVNEFSLMERIHSLLGMRSGYKTSIGISDEDVSINAFHDEVTRLIKALRAAFDNNAHHTMRELTHQLLGIAGVFKLPSLDDKATELMNAVKEKRMDAVEALLESLAAEASQFTEPV